MNVSRPSFNPWTRLPRGSVKSMSAMTGAVIKSWTPSPGSPTSLRLTNGVSTNWRTPSGKIPRLTIMRPMKHCIAVFCAFLLIFPSGGLAADHGLFSRVSRPYRLPQISSNNLANSSRIESLLRAGNLYLSLQDAIALALENNIDLAIQRYGPQIADATVMQAEAGGFARGVSTTVT